MDCTFYDLEKKMWVAANYVDSIPNYENFVYIHGESLDGGDGIIVNKKDVIYRKSTYEMSTNKIWGKMSNSYEDKLCKQTYPNYGILPNTTTYGLPQYKLVQKEFGHHEYITILTHINTHMKMDMRREFVQTINLLPENYRIVFLTQTKRGCDVNILCTQKPELGDVYYVHLDCFFRNEFTNIPHVSRQTNDLNALAEYIKYDGIDPFIWLDDIQSTGGENTGSQSCKEGFLFMESDGDSYSESDSDSDSENENENDSDSNSNYDYAKQISMLKPIDFNNMYGTKNCITMLVKSSTSDSVMKYLEDECKNARQYFQDHQDNMENMIDYQFEVKRCRDIHDSIHIAISNWQGIHCYDEPKTPIVYTIPCLITEDNMEKFKFVDTYWFPWYSFRAVEDILQCYVNYIQWHSYCLNPFMWHWSTSSYRELNRLGRAIESVDWNSLQNTRSNIEKDSSVNTIIN